MFSRSSSSSALPADQQSVVPTVRGLPWWGAVLLATAITIFGALVDSAPTGELGRTYKIIFIFGCVIAALAVRRRAMFTAAVQPPLIAFVIGLIALYIEAGDQASDKKTLILKVVLPIATSFPWMVIAFVLCLAVVLGRLFFTGPVSKRPFGGFGANATGTRTAGKKASTKQARAKAAPKKPASKKSAVAAQGSGEGRPKRGSSKPDAARGASKQKTHRTAPKSDATRASKPAADPRAPQTAATTPEPSSATRKPRPRPQPAGQPSTGEPAPRRRAAAPTASRPGEDKPTRRPRRAAPPQPQTPSDRQAPADAATPKRRPRRTANEDATKHPDRQRAQPQKIPARPRRTAGQHLRERGDIEDLTAGLDD
ncbi:hypothetical protein L5G32_14865 [Gordonia sp. HY002]|uniref:DUF6542 domain-containing protein n=1 Tax=Gordonia zhenghanii TaxID=2911516 RepID=UPI001EF01548|nr:DUF6542 domain-containing protein [Gordonia zhenghanii]MCF8571551.1 hypothetical protein [Gordonia zhenghanii]MCF8605772.1 hypothetical protein [Gordonia zhenghanii]